MRNLILNLLLSLGALIFAQEKKFEVTETVEELRAKGYPLNVLEELPMVKGCESLAGHKGYLAKCMKDQINFIFAPFMKGAEKVSKGNGVRVYIEFVINQDGSISAAERVKVSEQDLDEFTREAFEKFRKKINDEKIFVSPGRVHERDVNTLYGVRYLKAFKRAQKQ